MKTLLAADRQRVDFCDEPTGQDRVGSAAPRRARRCMPGIGENLRDHYVPRTRWLVGKDH
jgi:hypothetical protein